MPVWLSQLRTRIADEFGVTQWLLHLRPNSPLLPGQAVFRVFECRERWRGPFVERTAVCGLAVAAPIPPGQAFEAQVAALETGQRLSLVVQHVLECHAVRVPDEREFAVDVMQRPGQDDAWYCQVLLSFEAHYED